MCVLPIMFMDTCEYFLPETTLAREKEDRLMQSPEWPEVQKRLVRESLSGIPVVCRKAHEAKVQHVALA
jgi:hypothetical protein